MKKPINISSFQYMFRHVPHIITISESLHWHFPNSPKFFSMASSKTSYAVYLKELLIRISNEICLKQSSHVNLFFNHICLHS